ncbi:right-handed parallel beta-helix repeat-containing protein [Oscillatoria sp. FACHB-1407]|uniref:right-handed parallel beta-helix repeat-containing protein n=1 Tax=Oscillatoria sp. FACHB-1407 TaxID=2692847 RepID=UPI001681F8FC|nr:right-handed parallel beta-helix repeat-containing protein [Oscillatoria sp. FACHB-1407]MBD2461180.1 right-handed parallel beta-helix repeat-containing protein [Oscillatoria sp. FACHB-1407]
MKKVARYVSAGLVLTPTMSDAAIAQVNSPGSTESPDTAIATPQARITVTPENTAILRQPAMQVSQPELVAQIPVQKPETETTGTAADLRISPRIGIGHNSSGGGYDGTTRFEGFLPLFQTSGRDIAFLEGRFLLDNDANVGGNLLLGYRAYSPSARRTFGGYIAYDNRDTDENTFNQLGVGFESLGDLWDFRVNGYLPIGDRQQEVGTRQLLNTFFQERSLILQERSLFEAAVGGVDVEAGAKLAELGNDGDLRGYGGLYWYDAPGSPSGVGWRLRLEARPTDSLNVGLGVQGDELFGTNILFRVGLTFPGRRPRRVIAPENTVVARLGETVERNPVIVVDTQETISDTVATNPTTGEPYVFQHVNLGRAGGNGTFENPFGTIQPALDATQSDGNAIVYVRPGSNPGNPGFVIPDEVQVLSNAPVQRLNTREYGVVRLPLSGAGVRPRITDSVVMGSNTTLSGFDITGRTGAGVIADTVSNAVIRDNRITSAEIAAVQLEDTGGTITLDRNRIVGNTVPVLLGTNINQVNVTNSTLTSTNSTTNGITLTDVTGAVNMTDSAIRITTPSDAGIAIRNATAPVTIAAEPGQITNAGAAGIVLENSTGAIAISGFNISSLGGAGIRASTIANATLDNNTITTSTDAGIFLENTTGTITVTDSTVTANTVPALVGNTIANLQVRDSRLNSTNSASDGITLNGVSGTATIQDSAIAITTPAANGIALTNVTGSAAIAASPGTITNPANAGVLIQTSPGRVSVSNLQITGAGSDGITGDTIGTVTLNNNAIANSTNNGVALSNITGSATVNGNTITTTGQSGITITNATNTSVNENTIEAAIVDGIALNNVTGTATVNSNTLTSTGQNGILLNNTTGQVNLTASGNQISIPGASGINVDLSGDAGGTATITNNSITNAAQQGIALNVTSNGTTFRPLVESNVVTGSGDAGVTLAANGTTQIAAGVRLNQFDRNNLSGTAPAGVNIVNNASPNLCVQLRDNTSSNTTEGFNLQQNLGDPQTFDAEIGANNVGTLTTSGTVVNSVAQGTCGF